MDSCCSSSSSSSSMLNVDQNRLSQSSSRAMNLAHRLSLSVQWHRERKDIPDDNVVSLLIPAVAAELDDADDLVSA